MKKRINASIIMGLVSMLAFGQTPEPTKLRDANLQGNVLAVKYRKYEYKENFGEPTTGKTETEETTFYDEEGRSVLVRRTFPLGENLYVDSYLFDYSQMKATCVGISTNNLASELAQYDVAALRLDDSFEKLMKTLKSNFSGCNPTNHSDFTFDADNVKIQHTLYADKWSNHKILCKQVAKPTGTPGVYKFITYKETGDIAEETTRIYAKGLLTKVDNRKVGLISYKPKIQSPETGTYKYNAKGQLISYTTLQQEERNRHETKYYRNDKGDVVKTTEMMYFNKQERDALFYGNYQYDAHGNWVLRTYGSDPERPRYIEIREIIYCETADEVKTKNESLRQTAGQVIQEFQ